MLGKMLEILPVRPSSTSWAGLFWCFAYLTASQAAHATTIYNLSLSGDFTGSGAIVFEDGAFDIDGVHDLADVLVSFELTVDGLPAMGELRATPPLTFTTASLLTPELLQYQVHNRALMALDVRAAIILVIAAVEVAVGSFDAQTFEDGGFAYRVDTSTLPFFRCDPRIEDCRATLSATAVPEPSSALLLIVMTSCLLAFAGWRGLAREKS